MIILNTFRITPDSQFIYIDMDCKSGYKYSKFQITKFNFDGTDNDVYNCISLLQKDAQDVVKQKQMLKLPISVFKGATMFELLVTSVEAETGNVGTDCLYAYCSDVSFVYRAMLDGIVSLHSHCVDRCTYDDITRNYLILYGHISAMEQGFVSEAVHFYDALLRQFKDCISDKSKCDTGYVNTYTNHSKSCNCGR